MSAPADQAQRDRFIHELSRNFSVIAAAGSGKTRAITDRIIAIATSAQAEEWLPTLVVVTFTNRAADEMQQRARQSLLAEGVSLEVLAAFNRAFFGTIHSFCVKLLHQFGHHLGLAGHFETTHDDDALWQEFVQQYPRIGRLLTAEEREALLRLVPMRPLMELGRKGAWPMSTAPAPEPFPRLDFGGVYAFEGNGTSAKAIARSQENLRRWEEAWQRGEGYAPLPKCESKPLRQIWNVEVGSIRRWVGQCALRVAAEIGRAYRAFRIARGVLGYDDQIALALELMNHPEAARRIRQKNFRVILDEAQDTDPSQFGVLLEIARPPGASGDWLSVNTDPPRPGHFCMVGDFQQSIYGDRADLTHYRRVHDSLLSCAVAEAVEFSVTFRLDQQQLDFVNATFRGILDGKEDQARYVELQPRPGILPGQVVRWEFGELPALDGVKDFAKARHEAERFVDWLHAQGLDKLRATKWSDVAILCPRKDWFRPLRDALRAKNFAVQLQSERDVKGDSPAYAWFTALVVVMAEPANGYEIVGVLREVFGLSDHDLAVFAEGQGARFQLVEPSPQAGLVGDTLRLLAAVRARLAGQPLFSAVQDLVQATRLHDRLLALPADEYDALDAELDELLTLAASAEADGSTLPEFAAALRDGINTTRDVRGTTSDAVQLITAHKAKGSEWPCVIVPFFARRIMGGRSAYPKLIRLGGETCVAFSREDIDDELDDLLKLRSRQETERLLYVALTRSRHTLVLAHDHELFAGKSGVSSSAQASVLRCTEKTVKRVVEKGANADAFATLPQGVAACAATQRDEARRHAQQVATAAPMPLAPIASDASASAAVRATHFIKRNPSALAEASLSEDDTPRAPRSAVPSVAQRYGMWWHGFVEHLDWRADAAAWDATFAAALGASPDAELSDREWALLRAQLTGGSALAKLLLAPKTIVHAELPFLWAMNERECLEGIIDLAAFDPASETWWIVDWKTNRPTAGGSAGLRTHYEPQLAAYWKAVSEMTGARVAAGLYATATGEWLPYDSAALAALWPRLHADPAALSAALEETDAR